MKKILIIEDDKVVRENTSEILQLANYEIITAENGKAGIEKATVYDPDLIICDILMPELDGYGVLQILKRNEKLQKTPVVFMSAKTNHEDIRKGMDLGASDYITKPFEESELLSAVASRIEQSEMLKNSIEPELHFSRKWKLDEIERAFEHKARVVYNSGSTIYSEGNSSNFIFYILEGLVKTYQVNVEGKELITNIFNQRSFFGFTSFLNERPYKENAKAIKNTRLIRIKKQELLELIQANPRLALDFMEILSDDLENAKDHLIHLAYDSVRKKTALTILQLSKKGMTRSIDISRADLASMLGIAKETLIRTLTDFKREELIKIDKNRIEIKDEQGLLKVS